MRTKSKGVRRLSIVAGIVGAIYAREHPSQLAVDLADFRHQGGTVYFVLSPLFQIIYWAIMFLIFWLAVRILAWVISGFVEDRGVTRKQEHLLEMARDVVTKTTDDYTPTDSWTDQDWNLFLAGSASPQWEQVVASMRHNPDRIRQYLLGEMGANDPLSPPPLMDSAKTIIADAEARRGYFAQG